MKHKSELRKDLRKLEVGDKIIFTCFIPEHEYPISKVKGNRYYVNVNGVDRYVYMKELFYTARGIICMRLHRNYQKH